MNNNLTSEQVALLREIELNETVLHEHLVTNNNQSAIADLSDNEYIFIRFSKNGFYYKLSNKGKAYLESINKQIEKNKRDIKFLSNDNIKTFCAIVAIIISIVSLGISLHSCHDVNTHNHDGVYQPYIEHTEQPPEPPTK